jgi:signal transduction histidine kinase
MSAVAELTPMKEPRKEGPKAEFLSWFQNAPISVAMCDSQGRVTAVNAAMERLLTVSKMPGSPLSDLRVSDLLRSDLPGGQKDELISDFLAGRRESFQIECPVGEHASPLRCMAWRASHLDDSANLLAFSEMVSSRKELPHQTDGFEALGRLTGGVAHDFNNLLTGVLLYSDLLLAALNPEDRARRYAEEIRKAGFEASGLVRQLLMLARPATPGEQALSLNESAQGMRNFLARLLGENIELKLHLDPNLGLVQMNPARAQQILLNLVLNARDAISGAGAITVETNDCKLEMLGKSDFGGNPGLRCALLVVADNGHGMDAETRQHLFEPFFTTKAEKGTGLGLSTVRDIVSSHGGLIHVESGSGRGTRVSILLPALSQLTPVIFDPKEFHPATGGKINSLNDEE